MDFQEFEEFTGKINQTLNEKFPFFYTALFNQGMFDLSDEVEAITAIARPGEFRKSGETVYDFYFNPEFCKAVMSDEEGTPSIDDAVFMVSHELMHVLLSHIVVMNDDSLFPNKDAAGIAADIIANEYLASDPNFVVPEWATRGRDFKIFNAWRKSFFEVYDTVCESFDVDPDTGEDENGENPIEGDAATQSVTEGGSGVNDHSEMKKAANEEFENIDDLEDAESESGQKRVAGIKDFSGDKGQGEEAEAIVAHAPGQEPGDPRLSPFEMQPVSLDWKNLIQKVNPDAYAKAAAPRAAWERPSRKTASLYPRVILPSRQSDPRRTGFESKPAVVLAVDVSSSIPEDVKNKFASLGASIPTDKVDVFGCTFSTQYIEVDFKDGQVPGGGGTDFSAISEYIVYLKNEKKIDKYPDVIVFTDGAAEFSNGSVVGQSRGTWDSGDLTPNDSELSKWNWLLEEERNVVGWDNSQLTEFVEKRCFSDTLDGYYTTK